MSRKALTLFIVLGVLWGSSYTLIKLALHDMTPLDLVTYRLVGAALIGIALSLKDLGTLLRSLRSKRVVSVLVVSSITSYIIPYLLIAWGEQRSSASIAGMLNATTPLFTALLSPLFFRGQRIERVVWLGIGVGMAGVVVVFAPWQIHGPTSFIASLSILGAAASYGIGILMQKRYLLSLDLKTSELLSVQFVISAVIVVILDPHAWSNLGLHAGVGIAFGLGIFNTAMTAYIMLWLIAATGAAVSSSVTYLIALVSVVEAVVLLGEHVTPEFLMGSVVIVVGVAVLGYGRRIYDRLMSPTAP